MPQSSERERAFLRSQSGLVAGMSLSVCHQVFLPGSSRSCSVCCFSAVCAHHLFLRVQADVAVSPTFLAIIMHRVRRRGSSSGIAIRIDVLRRPFQLVGFTQFLQGEGGEQGMASIQFWCVCNPSWKRENI